MFGAREIFMVYGSMFLWMAPVVLLMLAAPYIILRLRDTQQEVHDPQLGMKTALHLIGTLGILVGVSGLSIVLIDLITDDNTRTAFTEAVRVGLAMALSGLIITAGHWWFLYMRTNDRQWPAVRRTFVGCRLIIHGIIICVALTGTMITLFMENPPEEASKVFGGMLIVWFASWCVHFALMSLYTKQDPSPGHAGQCEHCGTSDLWTVINR